MSNKHGQQGQQGGVPAPSPNAARVEPPNPAPDVAAPAPATVDSSGTVPPFTEPFESQAGMPPPATPSPSATAAKLEEQDPGGPQAKLDAGKGNAAGKSSEALAKTQADKETKQRAQGKKLEEDQRKQAEFERTTDPSRGGRPIPEGAVMVKALKGTVVRVQHRQPGERFWMMEERPKDDPNLLSEYAEEFEERGEVEIL